MDECGMLLVVKIMSTPFTILIKNKNAKCTYSYMIAYLLYICTGILVCVKPLSPVLRVQ